jgi:Protein of unknown function (DUF3187)
MTRLIERSVAGAAAGLVFGVLTPLAALAQGAAPPAARGPFEAREQWLLGQNRLSLPSTTPDPLAPGETRLRLDVDWGNDFGWNQQFVGEDPGERRFLVDGEHSTLGIELRRGVSGSLSLGARLPLCWRGAGTLDGVIDWWHRLTAPLGIPDNGRSYFENRRFRVLGRDHQMQPVVWGGDPGFGLGELELDARWTLRAAAAVGNRWRAALVARAGLPTGTGPFNATGAALGIQGVAARGLGRSVDVYLGAGGTVSSEDDGGEIEYDPARFHGFLALEWRLGRRWSLLAEGTAASRLVTNLDSYPALQSYLRMGAKVDLSPRWRLEAGFTENLEDQDATTDFGIFSGIVRRF